MSNDPKLVLEDLISGLQERKYTLNETSNPMANSTTIHMCIYILKLLTNEETAYSIVGDFLEERSLKSILVSHQIRLTTMLFVLTTILTFAAHLVTFFHDLVGSDRERND